MSELSGPEAAASDDKDWTWTTRQRCPECGFDPAQFPPERFPTAIAELAGRVVEALGAPGASSRPDPTTWSKVEYAYHVADVCEVMAQRLAAILGAAPAAAEFASWDGEAAAVERRYWRATPAETADLLRDQAQAAAETFALPVGQQWQLRGLRGDGVEFTAATLGLYLLHELAHHAHDVGA